MFFISGVLDQHLPSAYVLEAPSNSTEEYITNEKRLLLTTMKICGAGNVGLNLAAADLAFETHNWIRYLNKPVFILHAEDDAKVSFELGGRQLFQSCSMPTAISSVFSNNEDPNLKGCYHDFRTLMLRNSLKDTVCTFKILIRFY